MASTGFDTSASYARELDARDPLARYRARFHIPKHADGRDCVYLCGHSLGLQPKSAREYIEQELKDWEVLGVEGHFRGRNPWMPYHRLLTETTARLVGGKPVEVVVMNSLTVNLHLMMVSFYRPTKQRHKIVIEGSAFPSDQYAVKSQIRFHGFDPAASLIELTPRSGEATIGEDDIQALIAHEGESIALIMLGGVNYSTGQAFGMEAITRAGQAKGCIVGFDLAHAAGNIVLRLHDWNVDFAVWCSYKYLNGGPGCIAGCFVHERHAQAGLPRFAGWWGHDQESRFRMGPDFQPMRGAEGWQLSNPSILSLAALRASMDIFDEAGIESLRAKSIALTGYMEALLEQNASPTRFSIITPRDPHRRGAQLSLKIAGHGPEICDRLISQGILCDWREPDLLRVAPVPLYNSFADVHTFVEAFRTAIS